MGFLDAALVAEGVLAAVFLLWIFGWTGHREGGILWYFRREPATLEKVDCTDCGGMGVVWLEGGRWRVIPPHLREMQPGKPVRAKLGNVQNCGFCKGVGHTWRRKDYRRSDIAELMKDD